MARLVALMPPTQLEMQTSLSRWQDVLLHISSAGENPACRRGTDLW
jgi:hypothetical protein